MAARCLCFRFFCGSTCERHLTDKKSSFLSAFYIKQIIYINKYQLYTNAIKKDDYRLQYLNDLFGIKLIFYDP